MLRRALPLLAAGAVCALGFGGAAAGAAPVRAAAPLQLAKLVATGGAAGDELGFSTAISSDGKTVVIGAPSAGSGAGAVYVFTGSGSTWHQAAKLTESAPGSLDGLGTSVAIDGTTIVAGAPQANGFAGAAYVFAEPGGGWANGHQSATLTASAGASDDDFGSSIGISGSTVVVGAGGVSSGKGAAYVYNKPNAGWSGTLHQAATLTATSTTLFGYDVAISDGTIVAGTDQQTGSAAYVFTGSGTTWTLRKKLTATGLANGSGFGVSVAIDGGTIAVGAPDASGTGAAFVFTGSAATWTQAAKLTGSDATTGSALGISVAVDGSTVVAGAPGSPLTKGAAYVYSEPGGGWANETQTTKATASDGAAADAFGVDVAANGGLIAAGAPHKNSMTGAAYLYSYSPGGPPGRPAITSATPGDGKVTVKFTAPASNGGSAIDYYTATATATGQAKKMVQGVTSPIIVTDLTNGAAYTLTVTAHNAGGFTSAASAGITATPVGAPGMPAITSTTPGDGDVLVKFTAPASTGGSAIDSYTVTATATGHTTKTAQGTASPIDVTSLTDGTTYTFTVTAHNKAGLTSLPSASTTDTPEFPAEYAFAVTSGTKNDVYLYRLSGSNPVLLQHLSETLPASVSITSIALGDVTGDGIPDIVEGASNNAVYVVPGTASSFSASQDLFIGPLTSGYFANANGLSVAADDLNGTGKDNVIVGAGPGGGPQVNVYGSGGGLSSHFIPLSPSFNGGVTVAAGNFEGAGHADDIVVGAGAGGGPNVKLYRTDGTLLASFFAFSPGFTGGVSVAAGNLNGAGTDEMIVGAGPGGGPVVSAFSSTGSAFISPFYAYDSNFTGGVSVATADLNGDGKADIVTVPAKGTTQPLRIFSGVDSSDILLTQAFSSPSATAHAYVAAWSPGN